jgi:hypothetical protein
MRLLHKLITTSERKMNMKKKILLGAGMLICTSWASAGEIAATPYRPTISNPAELSAPGWLEVEWGMGRSKGGTNSWQDNQPYTLKYAFSEDFGILLGGDLRIRQIDASDQESTGQGDNLVLLKNHFAAGTGQAFGVEWGAKLATATVGMGSGENDYIVNGIYSVDVEQTRIDANLGASWLGLNEEGLGREQYNWALAVSQEVVTDWTLASELSGSARQGAKNGSQFMLAASYAASNRLVLDFGAATGLSGNMPDWTVFAGVTWLAGNLH